MWNPERGEAGIPSKTSALAILDELLGDGTQLVHPDTQALTDTAEAVELRLEAIVRRRLERQREPRLFHPIDPRVETEFPAAARAAELSQADVESRSTHRRDFHRELRKRIAERGEQEPLPPNTGRPALPPGMKTNSGVNHPGDFPGHPVDPPAAEPMNPVKLGDSLAARARRLKKQREE